jgi:guanylate kinase
LNQKKKIDGKVIIFSAPSGAGKTTIVRSLLDKMPALSFSISACSREPRPNEINGKDYFFIGTEGFRERIKKDLFLEWEEVYTDHYYGTLNSELTRIWSDSKTVVFDVDVEGGITIKKKLKESALSIFVMPPSIDELEKRLRSRKTETEEKIRQRISKAALEISQSNAFDVVLENDDLEQAISDARVLVEKFINT